MLHVEHRVQRIAIGVGAFVAIGTLGVLWASRGGQEDGRSETGLPADVAAAKAEAPHLLGAACRLHSYPFDETVGGIERQQLVDAARGRAPDAVASVYATAYRDQAEARVRALLDIRSTDFSDVAGHDDCRFEVHEWESVHVEGHRATLTVRGVFAERPHRRSANPVDADGWARFRPSAYQVVILREGHQWLLASFEDLDPVPPG